MTLDEWRSAVNDKAYSDINPEWESSAIDREVYAMAQVLSEHTTLSLSEALSVLTPVAIECDRPGKSDYQIAVELLAFAYGYYAGRQAEVKVWVE